MVCRLDSADNCAPGDPPKAAQRKRSSSTPEQCAAYDVTAEAGCLALSALTMPDARAAKEDLLTFCIPGPVSPPRYLSLLHLCREKIASSSQVACLRQCCTRCI